MDSQTLAKTTIGLLNDIRKKGFIHSQNNGVLLHYQKMDYALDKLLATKSVPASTAVQCMEQLVEICRKTHKFFPLFPQKILDLYNYGIQGDSISRSQANTKLLFFFSFVSPETVAQKKDLLKMIQKMPDWLERKPAVSKVLWKMVNHYDTDQQFNEDPKLSFLKSLSNMLHQICNSSEKRRNRANFTNTEQQKALFNSCAAFIRTCAPDFYEEAWLGKFAPVSTRKTPVPKLREAAKAARIVFGDHSGISRMNNWERN